jgi:hypothetical protein
MDKSIGSDDVIGYGIIDLDPYLNVLQTKVAESDIKQSGNASLAKEEKSTALRCFLSHDRKQAGFVTMAASFKEEKTDIINFRFETA